MCFSFYIIHGHGQLRACFNNVGLLRARKGDFRGALTAYTSAATAAGGNDGAAEFNLAVTLEQLKEYEEATYNYARAAVKSPNEAVVPRIHGRMCTRLGRTNDAQEIYKQAAARGVWQQWQQRSAHIVHNLTAQPWHWPVSPADSKGGASDAGVAPSRGVVHRIIADLEAAFPEILAEVLALPEVGALARKSICCPLATDNLLENTDGVPHPPPPPISVLSGRQPATFYLC